MTTPGRSLPGMGGLLQMEPVARMTLAAVTRRGPFPSATSISCGGGDSGAGQHLDAVLLHQVADAVPVVSPLTTLSLRATIAPSSGVRPRL